MSLPLIISCSSKYRLVLPFWYWLIQVVPDKGLLNESCCCCCCCCCCCSVVTQLRCSGIFNNHFTTNLLTNLPVKEFWKSVTIWLSYCYEFGLLFGTQCVFRVSIRQHLTLPLQQPVLMKTKNTVNSLLPSLGQILHFWDDIRWVEGYSSSLSVFLVPQKNSEYTANHVVFTHVTDTMYIIQ